MLHQLSTVKARLLPKRIICAHTSSHNIADYNTPTDSTSSAQPLDQNTSSSPLPNSQQLALSQGQPLLQLPSSLVSSPSESRLVLDQQQRNVRAGSTSMSTRCKCNCPNARCISCKCCQEKRSCQLLSRWTWKMCQHNERCHFYLFPS